MKKSKLLVVVFLIILFYTTTYTVFAHNANLFTINTWQETYSQDLQYRNWFFSEGNHIPETLGTSSNPVKYYISDTGYGRESDVNWFSLSYSVTSNITINWSIIRSKLEESMTKWNNVYFRDQGVDKRILYMSKTSNVNEANIIVYPSALKSSFDSSNYDYSYINDGNDISDLDITVGATFEEQESCTDLSSNHKHCTKYRIIVNIREIYKLVKGSGTKFNNLMSKLGAHEMGHVLGLADIETIGIPGGWVDSRYPESIMANKGNLSEEVLDIAYQDVLGAAIFRGLHTDTEHQWLREEYNGNMIRYRCAICNGYKKILPSGEIIDYGHGEENINNHVHTDEELIIVGKIKFPNNSSHQHYYKKCKYCSYIEVTFNNIVINMRTDSTHSCTCSDCGYQWVQNHNYHFLNINYFVHDHRCKVCNYSGALYGSHDYSYECFDNETHNMKCNVCSFEDNENHYFEYDENTGKNVCIYCNYTS